MEIVVLVLGLLVGLAIGVLAGLLLGVRRDAGRHSAAADQAVIAKGLDRLDSRMRELETQRASWEGRLHQQVDDLRRETGVLATALRKPQVRGQWGELHLRRCVEAAGMVAHCDFSEQGSLRDDDDGLLRPDLVVHLAGERSVVVDAKTPLQAYLDALAATDEDQPALLAQHARQVRRQVDNLSGKAYWSRLPASPEFVVCFLPAESCLAAALEADPGLIEYAAARKVVLASPTTLIALLRTVAHGWTTQALVESTREIHELGRALHSRLATMGDHLGKLGRSLGSAVDSYNATVGSLESRVLVTARQFEDIGVSDVTLPIPDPVVSAVRPLSAPELHEALRGDRGEPRDGESRRSSA